MEKVASTVDCPIALQGLPAEVNGTLNSFVKLVREAPPWLMPICEPGKDWKVFEAKGREYMSVLNALIISRETAAEANTGVGVERFNQPAELYDSALKAAVRTGRFKAFEKAQAALYGKAYWEANNDAQDKSKFVKYLHALRGSDGSLMLRTHFACDAETLAGLIALKDVDFPGKKEYMDYAIGKVEPWLKGFGMGGYCQRDTCAFYVKGNEEEKAKWLEKHSDYLDRVNAFFAELRASCRDNEDASARGRYDPDACRTEIRL